MKRVISVLLLSVLLILSLLQIGKSANAYNAVPPGATVSEGECGLRDNSGHITSPLTCIQFGHFLFDITETEESEVDPQNPNHKKLLLYPSPTSRFDPCEDVSGLMSSHLSDDPNRITFDDAMQYGDVGHFFNECEPSHLLGGYIDQDLLINKFEPGICGGTPGSGKPAPDALGKSCVQYGDLLFDVIGVRESDTFGYYPLPNGDPNHNYEDHLLGLCQITRTDGYSVTYPPAADDPVLASYDDTSECPQNSLMLLLSNTTKTAQKPTLQGDATDRYQSSNLKENIDKIWELWKNQAVEPNAVETLSDMVIARDLEASGKEISDDNTECNWQDGLEKCNHGINDENQYRGTYIKRASLFPLSSFEACTLYYDGCNQDIIDYQLQVPNPSYDPSLINALDYSDNWALRSYSINSRGSAVNAEGWVDSQGREDTGVVRPAMFVDLMPREQKPIEVALDHPELNKFVSVASGGSSSRGFEWESLTPDVCKIEGAATGALKTLQKFKLIESGECEIQIRKGPDSIFVEGGYKKDGYKVSKLSYSVGGEPDETGVQNEKAFTVAPLETKVSSSRGSIKRPGYHFNAWTIDGVTPIPFGSKFNFYENTVLNPFWEPGDPPVEQGSGSGCDTVEREGQIVCIDSLLSGELFEAESASLTGVAKPVNLASTGVTKQNIFAAILLFVLLAICSTYATSLRLLSALRGLQNEIVQLLKLKE